MLKQSDNFLKSEIDPAFTKRAKFIFSAISDIKPKKVLDAGCGRGFYSYSLQFFPGIKEIHGFDLNSQYVKLAKAQCNSEKYHLIRADIYKLPYKSDTFDFIILSEVLEHLPDEQKALRELRRVLKKGGYIAITVPNADFPFLWDPLNWILMRIFSTHVPKHIWWLAGIWADHIRLYTDANAKKVISSVGFTLEKQAHYVKNSWPFSHFILYGLGKNIVERFGGKQFSRFNFDKKPLSESLARIFGFPSIKEKNITGTSVSLCYLYRKR